MNGIKARAEDWIEPPYQEALEIVLWVIALLAGLAGAVLFVVRRAWIASLAIAVSAVVILTIFTFAQPRVSVRALLDATLLVGVWIAGRRSSPTQAA